MNAEILMLLHLYMFKYKDPAISNQISNMNDLTKLWEIRLFLKKNLISIVKQNSTKKE